MAAPTPHLPSATNGSGSTNGHGGGHNRLSSANGHGPHAQHPAGDASLPVSPEALNQPGFAKDRWYAKDRLGGLRRFALAITIFNIIGHAWLGFEQSYMQPLVGLAAAYAMELLMELIEVLQTGRKPRMLGKGVQNFVDFFLPAQISGLACAMLLYSNDRLAPIAFAAATAIASKGIFRVMTDKGPRHFLNPSNFGITVTLLLFPWVGIAQPYHFTENLHSWGDWALPGIIICTGSLLNTCFTRRLPLIVAWLLGFATQAYVRHLTLDQPLAAALMPMTGVAFILFTFYMVTDPPTTPTGTKSQIAFGLSVAALYGILMANHVVFGLFFALTIVCVVRGVYMYLQSLSLPPTANEPQSAAIARSVARETALTGATGRTCE